MKFFIKIIYLLNVAILFSKLKMINLFFTLYNDDHKSGLAFKDTI